MKKFKNESGIIAVEASLVLFFLIFFMLFIWNFAGIFATQNAVSHAAMQTVQTIAADNMTKEMTNSKNTETSDAYKSIAGNLNQFLSMFAMQGVNANQLTPYYETSGSQRHSTFEDLFYYYLADGKNQEALKKLHVEQVNITIDESAVGKGQVKAKIIYVVDLRFGVFGLDNITLTKHASCNLFGYSK